MCQRCQCKEIIHTTTTYAIDLDGCVVVITNVPCDECEACGETYFSLSTSKEIEKLVSAARQLSQEVSVINFSKVA